MGLADSAKEIYTNLEERYYAFLDKAESSGIPVYKVIDPIEDAGIPSFPIALLIFLIAVVLVFGAINSALFGAVPLEVTVQDSDGNPIEFATVSVSNTDGFIDEAQTDSGGKATVNVPANTEITLSVSKSGFEKEEKSITTSGGSETITLTKQNITLSKTISFLEAESRRLITEPLRVEISCTGNDYSRIETLSNGQADVDVSEDCVSLSIRPLGSFDVEHSVLSLASDETFEVYVTENPLGTGSAVISITGENGKVAAGIDVRLYTVSETDGPGTVFDTKQTSSSGTATFSSVPSGRYYVVSYDRSGEFAEYDGLTEGIVQEVREGEITSFAVVMSESVAGKIKLKIVDSGTGDAISSASVTLSKGETLVSTQSTDGDGLLQFSVGEDIEYNLIVDKAGYLILNQKVRPSADLRTIEIDEATVENSQGLLVNIVDELNAPLENVRVKLKQNSDGSQVGAELVTGLDGRAVFERIEEGAYYVYAVKPGFGEKTSETFSVSSRQENSVKIKIPIGSGRIEAAVVDETGKAVAGASIRAVDFGAVQVLKDEISDSDGKKVITARADKKVFLIVSADGFMSTTTIPIQLQRDVTISKKVILYKQSQKLGIEFEEMLLNGEKADDESGLSAGQEYTAMLRLIVPQNSSYDEAGVHLRTGKEQNDSIEKDLLYITNVRAATEAVIKGTTYNPPLGQASDLSNSTAGNAKWSNITFSNVKGGVYEIEADIQVNDDAKIGSLLEFWYRAYAKSGGYLREPNDAVLGSASTNSEKQGLYANAKKRVFSVGPTSLCSDDFCASYSIEDISGGITSSVFENYDAQVSGKYRLIFDITSKSESPFSAGQLAIRDRGSSILIDSYNINTARGEKRQGSGTGSEVSVSVGDISKDSVISGEIIFEAKREGTIPIEFSLTSGTATVSEAYRKVIYVKALPAETLNVDIIPKVIVPLINNNILVRVSNEDDAAVSNAIVTLKKNGEIVASGETDYDGIFAYTLLSPEDGSVVGVAVQKSGFAPIEKEIKVTGNILLSSPEILKLTANVGGKEYRTLDAIILNYSQIPLSVDEVSLSRDFENYANITFDNLIEGTVMAPDGNFPISGRILLGEKALDITQPMRIMGSLDAKVSNPNFSQQWLASIPFELTIGFGDEVDDTGCFIALPEEWEIISSGTNTQKRTITLTNACTVDGQEVNLRNVSMRVVSGSGKVPGEFKATTNLGDGKSVQLDSTFRKIADSISTDEGIITLEFKPDDVISANAETKIEIKATHFTSTGSQDLTKKMAVSININNLNECVEVLTDRDITVESCPYNTGYGGYGNYFSQYSNSRYSAYDPYSMRNGYGTGVPPYLGTDYVNQNPIGSSYYDYGNPGYMNSYQNSYYPNSSYSQPFSSAEGIAGYSGALGYGGMWRCGAGQFQIRNSCEADVEVSFDPQPGINVAQKTVSLEPGATSDIIVEPTNFFGRYSLGVKGKTAGTSQKTVDLKTLYVNVTNELFKNYRDCISVSPSRTLSFNNFIGKPVTLEVINTCFDQGVFLEASNNAIQFAGESISTPTNSASGFREMIESHAFLGEDIQQQASGKVTQVLTFELVKALKEYQNKAPEAKFFEENQFANIGNLRYFLTSGYYAVQGRANLIVKFTTPYGGSKSTFFPMIVQDYWNALEFADRLVQEFTTYGNPNLQAGQCINDDALNFGKLGDLPLGTYYTNENGNLFKIDEKTGCGNVDEITKAFNPMVFEDKTSGMIMKVTHDGHEATISFDPTKWNGQKAVFRESTTSTVTRVSPPRSQIHRFNITFNVKADPSYANNGNNGNNGGDQGSQGGTPGIKVADYTFTCSEGSLTGTGAFTALGMQHLSFDWRIPSTNGGKNVGVQINSCDELTNSGEVKKLNVKEGEAPLFCDAVQASISLSQKAAEVKKVVTNNKLTTSNGACVAKEGFECGQDGNKKATELFRYVLPQTVKGAYFLKKDSSGIDRIAALDEKGLKPSVSSTLNDLKGVEKVTEEQVTKITQSTDELITSMSDELVQDKYKGADIVLEIYGWNKNNITAGSSNPLDAGAMEIDSNKGWYVLTLNSYKSMRSQTKDCVEATECTLENGKTISLQFIQEMNNTGTWKLVASNKKEMSDYVKGLVMEAAEWKPSDEKLKKYANFLEFYNSNIKPSMYLIGDDYVNGFADKFILSTDYAGISKGLGLTFTNGAEVTGDYNVTVDYSWAKSSTEISFEQNRTLAGIDRDNALAGFTSEYNKNPLLNLAIDGKLNTGIGYTGIDRELFFFNNYGINDPALNPTAYKDGATNKTFNYKSNYADTKAGKIVSISANALEFLPSDPIKLTAIIAKAQERQPAGALFELTSSTNNNAIKQEFDNKWIVTAGALGQYKEGSAIETGTHKYTDLCKSAGLDSSYNGTIISENGSGTISMATMVYAPTDTAKATKSQLNAVCTKDSGTAIVAEDVLAGKKIADSTANKIMSISREGDAFTRTEYNLKNLIAMMKGASAEEAKTCVKTGTGTLDIYWNETSFLK